MLLEISNQLPTIRDVDQLLEQVLSLLQRLVKGAANVYIVGDKRLQRRTDSADRFATAEPLDFQLSSFIWQYLESERQPYVSGDVHQENWWPQSGPEDIRSFMAVPIIVEGQLTGMLTVDDPQTDQYDNEQVESVQELANFAGIAIEHTRLRFQCENYRNLQTRKRLASASVTIQSEQQQNRQLTLLHDIATVALLAADYEEMLQVLAMRLEALFCADGCVILLWDEASQRLVPAAASNHDEERLEVFTVSDGNEFTRYGLDSDSVLALDDAHNTPHLPQHVAEALSIRSALILPLSTTSEQIGVAIVGFRKLHRAAREDLEIGRRAASEIAVAIGKAKRLRIEKRQRQFAEVQLQFSFKLMETTTLVGTVEALLGTINEVVAYDAGCVTLPDPDSPEIGYAIRMGEARAPIEGRYHMVALSDFPILNQIRSERTEVYFADLQNSPEGRPNHPLASEGVRSVFHAPLLYHQQSLPIGYLTLESYRTNGFSAEARNNITLLCNQTASAVRRIRLLEETQRRLNEVSTLATLSETLNRTFELEEMLQLVLNQVISILEQHQDRSKLKGGIVLRRYPGDTLRFALTHNLPEEYCTFFNDRPFYAHEGTFARTFLQGEWVELDNVEAIQDSFVAHSPDLQIDQLFGIPLKVGGEIIGMILVNFIVTDPTTRRLLNTITELAGSAIQKTRLLSQARNRAVELMEAYEALNEMDRSRDEFIENVTHDLRAPLTFIRGYTDLLLEGAMGSVNQEQREALEVIQERTDAMNRLVSEILKIKEIESQPLKEELVDIVAVARTAVRSALMTARRAGLDIQLAHNAEQVVVLGDADRLGQIFDNLLSNAIKYTQKRGEIRVQIKQNWTKILVSVSDTGIGIPAAELDRIWDRYYRVRRTSEEYSGTGLGLANVRRIIEAHGGHIWVQSNAEGTTFTFELPLHSQANEAELGTSL